MIGDPASAPPRPDLTFLRRRSRPARPTPASPKQAASGPGISFDRPGRRPAAAPGSSGSLDLSAPTTPAAPPGPGISFDRPGRGPAATPQPATPPAVQPAAPVPASPAGSLDLSSPTPTPVAAPAPDRPATPALPVHGGSRVTARGQHLLSVKEPTVTLTRVQSGIGQLAIEAICSSEVGDLRLGAAYQLRGGASSIVQFAGGNRFAPSARRPVLVGGRDEYEHLRVDLRQVGDLERFTVYAFSEARRDLRWGGTLVLTTFGGGRIELPLETLQPGRVAVLLSFYNLRGELVVRAEMETVSGDIREAARAYGYDRITWRDDRSPVD